MLNFFFDNSRKVKFFKSCTFLHFQSHKRLHFESIHLMICPVIQDNNLLIVISPTLYFYVDLFLSVQWLSQIVVEVEHDVNFDALRKILVVFGHFHPVLPSNCEPLNIGGCSIDKVVPGVEEDVKCANISPRPKLQPIFDDFIYIVANVVSSLLNKKELLTSFALIEYYLSRLNIPSFKTAEEH